MSVFKCKYLCEWMFSLNLCVRALPELAVMIHFLYTGYSRNVVTLNKSAYGSVLSPMLSSTAATCLRKVRQSRPCIANTSSAITLQLWRI